MNRSKSDNPFSLSFGIEPTKYISRLSQINDIISAFSSNVSENRVYMLTGVRGSGKTVMLSNIANNFREDKNWIVIELSPVKDMLSSLASKLYNHKGMDRLFIDAKLNLSALGIGVQIEHTIPITDIDTAIERMLEVIKHQNKKVLILVDETVNNEYIKIFATSFQIFIRQKYPLYLLMTGLYENIYDLQNEKSLTFLYRAPKIYLGPLNINAVANSYRDTFCISLEEAVTMAKLTKGYPFAYQVLGYLKWNAGKQADISSIMSDYDQHLEEYVYEKIWKDLSEKDREIVELLAQNGEMKVKELRDQLKMKSGAMSVYRDRLIRKGIVDSSKYGYLSLILPRFAEIVERWVM